MFSRVVEVTAKTGKAGELSRAITEKTIPILRDQPGFVDEIVLVAEENPDRVLALSFWETRQDAEKYNRETFSQVTELIRNLIADTPRVQTFDVTASTVHDIATEEAA
jgi:heme-degrading monooxygenase HmoA